MERRPLRLRSMDASMHADCALDRDAAEAVDDDAVAAVLSALRDGPQPHGLPLVTAARAILGDEVGGRAFRAMEVARRRGLLRILSWREASVRGLPATGWSWCEDVR